MHTVIHCVLTYHQAHQTLTGTWPSRNHLIISPSLRGLKLDIKHARPQLYDKNRILPYTVQIYQKDESFPWSRMNCGWIHEYTLCSSTFRISLCSVVLKTELSTAQYGCRESNPSPLKEQQVFLPTEPLPKSQKSTSDVFFIVPHLNFWDRVCHWTCNSLLPMGCITSEHLIGSGSRVCKG